MNQYSIPYGKQYISEEDLAAVAAVLTGDFLTQGPAIAQFEAAFAHYVGSTYAVAVSNGTAALHLSCMALKVSENSRVITTPITFAASANCVRYCGGTVLFADIDPVTYLIDLASVKRLLENKPAGTIQGMIVVDFAGKAVNLEDFRALADQYNCWIIEDACHAPGGFFTDSTNQQQRCGNGKFADVSIFSFHPVKHIACGEGGMITTDNKAIYERLLQLRTHGITRNTEQFSNSPALATGIPESTDYPLWYMEMQELGFNYRLTDFQAALGLSQLKRADAGLQKRRQIAQRYADAFTGKSYINGQSGYDPTHAYHLYVIEVNDRLGLYNYLRTKGIFAQIHYFPAHLMPYYKQFGWKEGDFPNAEAYYNRCLSLPMFPTLTADEQTYVIAEIDRFYHA